MGVGVLPRVWGKTPFCKGMRKPFLGLNSTWGCLFLVAKCSKKNELHVGAQRLKESVLG